jgi:hypothetical protein
MPPQNTADEITTRGYRAIGHHEAPSPLSWWHPAAGH